MENEEKRQNEKDDIAYVQNYETFRDLNGHMWKIPMIAITITGGLLFGISESTSDKTIKIMLLGFAAVSNIGLILVLLRTRFIMGQLLEKIRLYNEIYNISGQGENHFWEKDKAVVKVFGFLLSAAAILCIGLSFHLICSY